MNLLSLSLLSLLPVFSWASFLMVHSARQYTSARALTRMPASNTGDGKVSLYMDGFSSMAPDIERAKVSKLNELVVVFILYVLMLSAPMARTVPNTLENVHRKRSKS